MPPTLYWLGQRVEYKILDNGCKEAVNVSSAVSRAQYIGWYINEKIFLKPSNVLS